MDQPVQPFDIAEFKSVMGRFATGVTVVATRTRAGGVHAITVNAFLSASLSPPLCLVSIGKRARIHSRLLEAGHFSVNVLRRDQAALSGHFSGAPVEGLDVSFETIGETPILPDSLAQIGAEVDAVHDCGDHSLFVGRIFHLNANEGEPLLYFAGHYGALDLGPDVAPATSAALW